MRDEKGQSLVEAAIFVPILIFILIGMIEVGWGIRNYLVLVNATREATRQAARTKVLDFSEVDPGYDVVLDQMLDSMGQSSNSNIPAFDLEKNATVNIHHLYISTGRPCLNSPCISDCESIDPAELNRLDDLILSPETEANFYKSYGITRTNMLADYTDLIQELVDQSNKLHCQMEKRILTDFEISDNSLVIVETQYDHRQLLGVPIIANGLTNPINMRTATTMRISSSTDQYVSCELAPFSI